MRFFLRSPQADNLQIYRFWSTTISLPKKVDETYSLF
jgi:hypothetical protein